MKIIMSACAFDRGRSGISRYMIENARLLLQHHQLTVIISRNDSEYWPLQHHNQTMKVLPAWLDNPALNSLFHLLVLPIWIWFTGLGQRWHVCFLPALNRRLMAFYPVNTIGTFHDLSQMNVHGKYNAVRMFYIHHIVPAFLRNRRRLRLVAVSANTRKDLGKFFGIHSSDITVSFNGFDKLAFNRTAPANLPAVMNKYALQAGFILYVARIEHPGKNHINLIKAFEQLPEYLRQQHPLVLVGGNWNGAEQVIEYAKQSCATNNIIFTGFVDDMELPCFYHAAAMMVMPSLYEGFGIPLVEAMACGTLVACANTGALPEIAGSAASLFNPLDIADIQRSIINLLQNPKLAGNQRIQGWKRAECFDWQHHHKQLLSLASSMRPC